MRRAQVAWPRSEEVVGPCLEHCLFDSVLCPLSQVVLLASQGCQMIHSNAQFLPIAGRDRSD